MSYNSNTNISFPGQDWSMLWPDGVNNVQLDIVGFLAILGESSMLANAQVSALSRLFYLPRLLPAPQALLRVTRPATLPPKKASVTSVKSGNKKEHIHHVASILLGTKADELKKHWVRCVRVTKKKTTSDQGPSFFDVVLRGQPRQESAEKGATNFVPATVKAKAAGPLTWVTLLGVGLTLAIMTTSIIYGDGMSLMALVSLSLLSSVCGIANRWELSLTAPPRRDKPSPEDMVVIRYPEGSFLVVKCNDEVARELFFAPEEINYTVKSSHMYRLLALFGSVLLMIGVILLANARLQLQLAWAGSYLILNAAHWAAAALPERMHWDLSCYQMEEEGIEDGPENASFTDALWKVILVTKRVEWVRFGDAAPNTKAWDAWARDASRAAKLAPEPDQKAELIKWCTTWPGATGEGVVHRLPEDPPFNAPEAFGTNAGIAAAEEARREAEEGEALNIERHALTEVKRTLSHTQAGAQAPAYTQNGTAT